MAAGLAVERGEKADDRLVTQADRARLCHLLPEFKTCFRKPEDVPMTTDDGAVR